MTRKRAMIGGAAALAAAAFSASAWAATVDDALAAVAEAMKSRGCVATAEQLKADVEAKGVEPASYLEALRIMTGSGQLVSDASGSQPAVRLKGVGGC